MSVFDLVWVVMNLERDNKIELASMDRSKCLRHAEGLVGNRAWAHTGSDISLLGQGDGNTSVMVRQVGRESVIDDGIPIDGVTYPRPVYKFPKQARVEDTDGEIVGYVSARDYRPGELREEPPAGRIYPRLIRGENGEVYEHVLDDFCCFSHYCRVEVAKVAFETEPADTEATTS